MAPVRLGDPVRIGSVTAKNRICIPPMVMFHRAGQEGMTVPFHVEHYTRLARGGPGLIIQEATCVSPEGRLSEDQLGIWSDAHVPGLRKIVEAVHREGVPIFLQLHHAGIMAWGERKLCPGDYTCTYKPTNRGQPLADQPVTVRGEMLSTEDVARLKQAFIDGGRRAHQAGYDGVELHGCHSYLLCQFLNKNVNNRDDQYRDALLLIREIFQGIRAVTSPEFVIGIRLGAFEPALSDGIAHAKALTEMGLQFLDVSYGFSGEMDLTAPGNPDFSGAVRGAAAIAEAVSIPVFAVDGIRTPAQAEAILAETVVSMTDVGRSALVDPDWPKKALAGEAPGKCLGCSTCQWRIDPGRCPGKRLLEAK